MSSKPVPVIDAAALEMLQTKVLLSRLRALQRCEDNREHSDLSEAEIAAIDGIVFKSEQAWRTAYNELKAVLSTRENVPSGPERKAARQVRAAAGRTHDKQRRR